MKEAISWNTPVEDQPDDRTILPDGSEVEFTVLELAQTRSRHDAPMAKLVLEVKNEHGRNLIYDYLVRQPNSEWRVAQFLRSIGQKRHGEPLVPQWDKIAGSSGRAIVSIERYEKDGQIYTRNRIKRFLDPVLVAAPRDDDPFDLGIGN